MTTKTRSSPARVFGLAAVVAVAGATALEGGCLVTEHCYSNADCQAPEVCLAGGACGHECTADGECGDGMGCVGYRCTPKSIAPIVCPEDMVNVAEAFCVDRYEASRSDATATSFGLDGSRAASRAGVLPWQLFPPEDNKTARDACVASGKDLCTPLQWRAACEGSRPQAYGYGDVYQPHTCNGIDTFGPGGLHLLPTGSLPQCVNDWGAYDMNGNLWEHTLHGSERTIRGGAYNCMDSQTLHRCDYVPGDWEPTARGFRCCLIPASSSLDAGAEDASVSDVSSERESGCLEEDAADVSVEAPQDAAESGLEASLDGPDTGDGFDAADVGTGDDASGGCPGDMARIQSFCMDLYEAARLDATATSQGAVPVASSRKGVMPWFPIAIDQARSACASAGKRLCRLDEWIAGCVGPGATTYSYGDQYDPVTCNGIDTYCDCGGAACGPLSTCPYPHCFSQASSEGGGPCGASFRVEPTGSFVDCHSPIGVYDLNGNVWELADTNDGLEHFRGGAYNCADSEALHRCDHDGTWGPSARGFRCCKDPE